MKKIIDFLKNKCVIAKDNVRSKTKRFLERIKEKMDSVRIYTEEEKIILDYLDKQIAYSEQKIEEVRKQIEMYPDDEYSQKDLQNNFYLRNVLLAMKRRIKFKN